MEKLIKEIASLNTEVNEKLGLKDTFSVDQVRGLVYTNNVSIHIKTENLKKYLEIKKKKLKLLIDRADEKVTTKEFQNQWYELTQMAIRIIEVSYCEV